MWLDNCRVGDEMSYLHPKKKKKSQERKWCNCIHPDNTTGLVVEIASVSANDVLADDSKMVLFAAKWGTVQK